MNPHVLIVTGGHLSRNPRVVKEAETLGHAGHKVTVLHVLSHPPSAPLDDQLASGAPYQRETLNLLPGAGPRSLQNRLIIRLARTAIRRFGWQFPQSLGPTGPLLQHSRRIPADLTIVHNEVAHGVGLRLRAEGRRVVADIEDWYSQDLLPEDRRHRPLELLRRQERDLLHQLAYTTTTSHALADGLLSRYGGTRPHVITNSFPLQPDPGTTRPPRDAPPIFFWFSQTLGPGRGLEAFLSAWADTTRPSRVVLLGEPQAGYREQLLAGLPSHRREGVEFLNLVPPGALPSLIAQHDIGLALEDPSIPSRDLTITNKILQYLNAGLAVVASDTAGQREVLSHCPEAGIIVRLEDTVNLTATLESLLADRQQLAAQQAAARRLAEKEYCWERETPRLLSLVEAALAIRT